MKNIEKNPGTECKNLRMSQILRQKLRKWCGTSKKIFVCVVIQDQSTKSHNLTNSNRTNKGSFKQMVPVYFRSLWISLKSNVLNLVTVLNSLRLQETFFCSAAILSWWRLILYWPSVTLNLAIYENYYNFPNFPICAINVAHTVAFALIYVVTRKHT